MSILRQQAAARTGLAAAACVIAILVTPTPAEAQAERETIVKESKEGEGLVLDASGLTSSFSFIKNMTRDVDVETLGGEEVEIHSGRLPTKGIDYENFLGFSTGIVEFQTAAAIKLRTGAVLHFGEVELSPGNPSPGYPGLYSLWLRKTAAGDWKLIFNHDADAWGTMYDPERDVGEVDLSFETKNEAEKGFTVDLDAETGLLSLGWGGSVWTTPFSVG